MLHKFFLIAINEGIVNAATTPMTPRVINTSAKVNAARCLSEK